MIDWLILIVAIGLCTVILHSLTSARRRRRTRDNFRHLTGAPQWWGKR